MKTSHIFVVMIIWWLLGPLFALLVGLALIKPINGSES